MIRKAILGDIEAIAKTYDDLLAFEAQHGSVSNWKPGKIGRAHV